MLSRHLTTEEIQELVINPENCARDLVVHADNCPACRREIAAYRMVFASIENEEVPALGFDLSEAVLAKIEKPVAAKQNDTLLLTITGIVLALMAGVVFYLFGDRLKSLFAAMASYILYLAVFTIVIVAAGITIDMYIRYKQKIKSLELY